MADIFERLYSHAMFALWLFMLWVVVIYRLAVADGRNDFFIHYTNWSWTFQAIYFMIDYVGRILNWLDFCFGKTIRIYNSMYWFWWVNGSVWLVIVIVSIIIEENPSLLDEAATSEGGRGALGFITNMHILFHYVPGYFVAMYMFLERDIIGEGIYKYFEFSTYDHVERLKNIAFSLVVIFSVVMPFVIYSIIFDPVVIYGFYTDKLTLAMISIGVIFFMNIVPFMIFVDHYVIKKEYDRVFNKIHSN